VCVCVCVFVLFKHGYLYAVSVQFRWTTVIRCPSSDAVNTSRYCPGWLLMFAEIRTSKRKYLMRYPATHCVRCQSPEPNKTRMWANAQRDGRPAEYRWRALFNVAELGWRPLPLCRAVTLPRRETSWNLLECPKLPSRSQPLVGWNSPYCGNMWRRHCCLTNFFSDCRYMPLLRRYSPTKLCDGAEMAILAIFYVRYF